MTTQKREKIIEKAKELYAQQCYKNGIPEITPEDNELVENGFYAQAQSELMRDNYKANVENDYIDFPQKFTININELMKGNALILGSRGIGKSDVGMRIVDKAMSNGMVCVAFDPSQDWQNRSNIPYFQILRIPYIDKIPIESIVYDISLLSPREHQQVVESFCEKLFRQQAETSNRKQYLITFEEAHTYFPQGCMRAKAYQNTVKLLSVGRNLDISCLLVSQFASMLDKFAVKHSVSQIYLGFTKEPNDLKYLRQFLGSEVEQLTKLNDGEFLYLTRDKLQKIAIEPYESHTLKTQIFANIPQPIKAIPQNSNGIIDIVKFIALAAIVLYALTQFPRGM